MNEEILNENVELNEEIVEETKEVEEVKEEVEEAKETYLVVKTDEFMNDYYALEQEKENALEEGLKELDIRVEEKLNALRPEIVEEVKKEIEEKKRAIVKDKVEDVAIGSISEIDILFPNVFFITDSVKGIL